MKLIIILLLLVIHTAILAQQKPWPTILKGGKKAKVIEEKSTNSSHIYKSKFFHFVSDSKLEINKLRTFATTSQSVYYALRKIPLDLLHPPQFDSGKKTHTIRVYSDIEAYDTAVGTKFSAGYYSKSDRAVFLRKDQFITSKKPNYQLLVHELTHLNMHGLIIHSNAWFSEGNAEYMASSLFGSGSYNFSNITTNIRNRALSFITKSGKGNESILIPSIRTLITLRDQDWMRNNAQLEPEHRYLPYLSALITIHYFYHLDPKGREKMNRYIKDLTSNNKELRRSAQQHLFKDTDFNKLEKKLTEYWKKKGLSVSFEK